MINNHENLEWQWDWSGPKMINKRVLVNPDELDKPQRQLGTIVLPPDPTPVQNARVEQYEIDEFDDTAYLRLMFTQDFDDASLGNNTTLLYGGLEISAATYLIEPASAIFETLGNGNDQFTKVLLHLDGLVGGTTIIDANLGGVARTWTTGDGAVTGGGVGNSKFGASAGQFNGTGAYLLTPGTPDLNIGSSEFAIDFWVKFTAEIGNISLFRKGRAQIASTLEFTLDYNNTTGSFTLNFVHSSNGTTVNNWTTIWSTATGTYYHFAVVRFGSTLAMFADGSMLASTTFSGTFFQGSADINVGSVAGTQLNNMTGFMDEVRFSIGTPRWTQNFTPPTSPYTNNGWIVIPSQDWLQPTGDYTIDVWAYCYDAAIGAQCIVAKTGTTSVGTYFVGPVNGNWAFYSSSDGINWDIASNMLFGAITLNTWTHLAVSRSGNDYYLFKDGVTATTFVSASEPYQSDDTVTVGLRINTQGAATSVVQDRFRGRLNGLRISNTARWTSDFTPPTEPEDYT